MQLLTFNRPLELGSNSARFLPLFLNEDLAWNISAYYSQKEEAVFPIWPNSFNRYGLFFLILSLQNSF